MAGKRKDRFEKLRTSGAGYETGGRENFSTYIEFAFDYSDMDKSARKVKKELSDFTYNFNKAIKRVNPKAKSSKDFVGFSEIKYIALTSANNPSEKFNLMPDGVQMRTALKDGMQSMGREGSYVMKKHVKRIDTGRMQDSVTYNTRSGAGRYTVRIGWTQLWYKYFGFQENGTRFINPMHSLIRTQLEMMPRVQNYLSRFIRSYTRGSGEQYGGKGVKF
jgi:hypothetical protein